MDLTRATIVVCAEGTRAEFERRLDVARRLYEQAWQVAADDYDRMVAAHYIAHLALAPEERLSWNLVALRHAEKCESEETAPLWGSLYVNLGESYEATGEPKQARRYYALAAEHGVVHGAG